VARALRHAVVSRLARTLGGSSAVCCYRVALQASSAHDFNPFCQFPNQSLVHVRKTGMQTQGDGAFGRQSLALQASARGVVGRRAQPNPALKGRSNGVPPGPGRRYGVHCLWPGPGVTPLASPLARTLGCTWPYLHPASTRLAQVGSPWPLPLAHQNFWQREENARHSLGWVRVQWQ
jgi:hypothetical protein